MESKFLLAEDVFLLTGFLATSTKCAYSKRQDRSRSTVARRTVSGTVFQIEATGQILITRSRWIRKFASWNPSPDITEGSAEYYSKQVYSQGTRCWNGPQRNVKVTQFSNHFGSLALTIIIRSLT